MNSLTCCDEAKGKPLTSGSWLQPASELVQLHMKHFQLFSCPGCGALWKQTAELVGHKDWDYSLDRVESLEQFLNDTQSEREEDLLLIERLKARYEAAGLDWRTGRPKQ